MQRDYNLFLEDILKAITRIKTYTQDMVCEEFKGDERTRDAVIRNLEVIGEAVKALPEGIRKAFPGIEWRKLARLRDKLIHHYFGLDIDIIWDIVENKLDGLEKQIEAILPLNNDSPLT